MNNKEANKSVVVYLGHYVNNWRKQQASLSCIPSYVNNIIA